MKNRFVRVLVITIIASFIYFTFFTEKVADIPKNKDNLTKITTDTLLNEKGYLVIGKPNVVSLIKIEDTIKYKDFKIIDVYKNDAILAKNIDEDNLEVYKKFSPESFFKTYKVSVYDGKLVEPNFNSNPETKMFATRIKEGCKEGVNFAGYYTLIYWGCGSSCQYGVIVNRKTGEIIDGYQSSLGSEFKKDSKLIILNSDLIEENTEYIPLYQFKKFQLKALEDNKFVSLD